MRKRVKESDNDAGRWKRGWWRRKRKRRREEEEEELLEKD